MAKVANVGEAMRKHAATQKRGGPTVLVRAIVRGYYGYPLSDTKEPGTEFRMRISDLKPLDEVMKASEKRGKKGRHYNGRPILSVKFDGKEYALPTWCEDAAQPSTVVDETIEPKDEDELGEDVLG